MKTISRLFLAVFVWFWGLGTGLYLIDLYFLRGRDPSTLGSPTLVLLLLIAFGLCYAAILSPCLEFLFSRHIPFSKKATMARIIGITLAAYIVLESFLTANRSLWGFFLWMLIIPLALGLAVIALATKTFYKEDPR